MTNFKMIPTNQSLERTLVKYTKVTLYNINQGTPVEVVPDRVYHERNEAVYMIRFTDTNQLFMLGLTITYVPDASKEFIDMHPKGVIDLIFQGPLLYKMVCFGIDTEDPTKDGFTLSPPIYPTDHVEMRVTNQRPLEIEMKVRSPNDKYRALANYYKLVIELTPQKVDSLQAIILHQYPELGKYTP